MEIVQDVPTTLNVERPVEVPQIMTAESITQVPVAQIQVVEKPIPKVMTEAVQMMQEVPQVLIEETLVEVPQVQVAEAIKQVPKEMIQARQKGIPKVQTQVREIVQAVSVPLINEVAMDVPQVQVVEVMKQTAALSQQRLVQTSRQYEMETMAYRTLPEERAGIYEAQVVGMFDKAVQPTVVERLSPVMTANYAGTTYGAPMYAETIGVAPTVVETVGYGGGMVEYAGGIEYATTAPVVEYVGGGMIYEQAVPMMGEVLVAPTMAEVLVAPTTFATEMLVAPTVVEMIEPVVMVA
jgi:hypothetical protein